MSTATFTLQSDTYTVYLNMPEWNRERNRLTKNIEVFDFWDNDLEAVDKDIQSQSLSISGLEEDVVDFCFPLCLPTSHSIIEDKFEKIFYMMEHHETVTISGLGDEYDGDYIIKSFRFKTLEKGRGWFAWSLDLELA